MDSTMYCLSGLEMCDTVRPASRETSLKRGAWAQAVAEKLRTRKKIVRITVRVGLIIEGKGIHHGDTEAQRMRRAIPLVCSVSGEHVAFSRLFQVFSVSLYLCISVSLCLCGEWLLQ